MKPHRVLSSRIFKHYALKPIIITVQSQSYALFSSVPQTQSASPNNPSIPHTLTPQFLLNLIHSSQWHLIKHLSPKLSSSLTSDTLVSLHETPELVLQFVNHVELNTLDIKNLCLTIAILARIPSPKFALHIIKQVVDGGIATTKEIFDEVGGAREQLSIQSTNVFDLLIRACCEMKRAKEAFECFYFMKETGFIPKTETCNGILSLLLKMNMLEMTWVIYAEMFSLKIKSSVYTFNIMINVLCKEGKLKKAKELIGFMENLEINPNVVTYNTLIHGFCSRGRVEGGRLILNAMKAKGIRPDSYTYGSLISGLCKERRLEEASGLFDKMMEIGLVPNAVTYNTLIDGYCNKGDLEKAFSYRDEMVKKGIKPTVSTYNLLIHALFIEGKITEADDLVKEMGENGLVPDAITYNILINGNCKCGNSNKAFSLLDEMLSKGIEPTRITYTSLIYVLSKRKKMKEADDLLKKMLTKGVLPDLVLFNALIDGHCANGNMDRAFMLLKEMDKMQIPPDEVTYNTLMQGRCRQGKVEEARQLVNEMKGRGIKPDFISYNTLISGYSKRGDMKDAFKVRDEMLSKGFNPTLLTYNSLIQGLCKNQEGVLAEELLKEMTNKGIKPDDNTYYSLIEAIGKDGNFENGHIVPGLALALLGLWHSINTIRTYFLKGPPNFTVRFWYPLNSPSKFKHLELIFILSFSVFAIIMEILDFPFLHLAFKLNNYEHATMFLHLAIFSGFTLCAELMQSLHILSGVAGVLISSVFGQELFLLHFHSANHVGIEGHYHWLLQVIVFISLMAALAATCFPTSLPATIVLSNSIVFQGCWFMNMGLMLWLPEFVPAGCAVRLVEGSSGDDRLGAVVCASGEADSRARALANLQFSWILAGILIFTGCISLKLAAKYRSRDFPLEYEQLQNKGPDIHIPMNRLTHAGPCMVSISSRTLES
ncbi:hypothetical protein G4B88_001539 [Cannabis sativa]|uniref:Uncharacterized protein n=1 Tax=Cannabis sativa TaxID=3483 RepID=A0A7J6FQA5_CANSA|nr:hypothetical protein G4B88_001539 [Cannabis sativa]